MTSQMFVTIVENLYIFTLLVFILIIIMSKKKTGSSIAWLVTVIFIPFIGMLLYIILGVDWRRRKMFKARLANNPNKVLAKMYDTFSGMDISQYDTKDIFDFHMPKAGGIDELLAGTDIHKSSEEVVKLLYYTSGTYPTGNRSCEFYFDGAGAMDSLIKDLESARENIYMEFFIWRSDELGERVKEVLIRKAQEGVDIRLITDGLGSFGRISRRYKRELAKAGIDFKYFLDVPLNMLKINYRNHRKMAIIDNKILHTGGMNIGQEYIDGGKHFDAWRDTNVRLEGEIVIHYLAVFVADWLNSRGQADFRLPEKPEPAGKYMMQIAASGPDTVWTSLRMLYTKMITNATEEILIETPYFVPSDNILEQLQIAALSGVKVKLIIAGVTDSYVTLWAAESYYRELLGAGINVYVYRRGFLHCKNVIVDRKICTTGSCNFDYRSFELDYEVNCVFYNRELSGKMREQFFEDLKFCDRITFDIINKRHFPVRLRNAVCRVLSPLL